MRVGEDLHRLAAVGDPSEAPRKALVRQEQAQHPSTQGVLPARHATGVALVALAGPAVDALRAQAVVRQPEQYRPVHAKDLGEQELKRRVGSLTGQPEPGRWAAGQQAAATLRVRAPEWGSLVAT